MIVVIVMVMELLVTYECSGMVKYDVVIVTVLTVIRLQQL
jgi:hypothetical protein